LASQLLWALTLQPDCSERDADVKTLLATTHIPNSHQLFWRLCQTKMWRSAALLAKDLHRYDEAARCAAFVDEQLAEKYKRMIPKHLKKQVIAAESKTAPKGRDEVVAELEKILEEIKELTKKAEERASLLEELSSYHDEQISQAPTICTRCQKNTFWRRSISFPLWTCFSYKLLKRCIY